MMDPASIFDDRFKTLVYEKCVSIIQSKVENAEIALEQAQEASQDDTKSSAGDKYETTREMMQQEISRNSTQLFEAKRSLFQLEQVRKINNSASIEAGSLVKTDSNLFYIAVSIGQIMVEDQSVIAVSPVSPLGRNLIGKSRGDVVLFNGSNQTIQQVI